MIVIVPADAVLLMPVKLPEDTLLKLAMLLTELLEITIPEVTVEAIEIPVIELVNAPDVDNTRMLLAVSLLPTRLLLISVGAEGALTESPLKKVDAGAAPVLLMSIPPIWLPFIVPPVAEELMPFTTEVFVDEVVAVLTIIELLVAEAPMIFPSPAKLPPMLIPDPLVSMPVNTLDAAAVGIAVIEIAATVFPLMVDGGEALEVVNEIPW